MGDLKRREDLIEAYEKYKIAAAALQEEIRLSFNHPGFSFDLTLCLALEKFKCDNQYVVTRLEQLILQFYIGHRRVSRLSKSLCARMNAAGVKEQPRTVESTSQQSENLKNNEQLRLAIMARPWEHNKAASHEESTPQEVLHASAATEETEVAVSPDSANKTTSDNTAAQDVESPNLDPDKTA